MKTADFLIEIQSEELPPKALSKLSEAFKQSITTQLNTAELDFTEITAFATPRRLAVMISNLEATQKDKLIEKRGPSIDKAFDANGKPTKACIGFANSCNTSPDKLITQKTDQGEWVFCSVKQIGKPIQTLMPEIINTAIKALPVPKWMRWGDKADSFARPVHGIIMLYGTTVIDATILGIQTGRITQGHRFLCKKPISIKSAASYEKQLQNPGYVIASFEARKQTIQSQIESLAKTLNTQALIDNDLLDEVTGLVEWPTAMYATFNPKYLDVPNESLISAIEDHQKSFPLIDQDHNLHASFIFVSNLTDKTKSQITTGNEKVMSARLADAEFFYHNDCKTKLIHRVEQLKHVCYQENLGSLYDQAIRLETLCGYLSNNNDQAKRAGLLAKTDLVTDMVFEFPELQGTMGFYYAKQDGEPEEIALALKEQYLPKFAGDKVAQSALGVPLSLASKLDTLVGHFGLKQLPTGNKDPFALRRNALGIIRTIITNELSFDLKQLLQQAIRAYQVTLPNSETLNDLLNFFHDRLRVWCKDQGYQLDVIDAVLALGITDIFDAFKRIQAVKVFKTLDEAAALAAANKRVSNIISKEPGDIPNTINIKLLEIDEEHQLYQNIIEQEKLANNNYSMTLKNFATMGPIIDQYFEHVLVNSPDPAIRSNRLATLNRLRQLFLQIADIALLQ